MLRSRDTLDTAALCGVTYEWLSSQKARNHAINGWEQVVGGKIEVLEIPGNHFQPFAEQNAGFLSCPFPCAPRLIIRNVGGAWCSKKS